MRQTLNLWGAEFGIGVQNSALNFRTNPAIAFFSVALGCARC